MAESKTIFCDIDGTLLHHHDEGLSGQLLNGPTPCEGVIEKLDEWQRQGHTIVLTTGRRESQRKLTEAHLSGCGLYYDALVMGLPNGERIVINDCKDVDQPRARAINVLRNSGLSHIELDAARRPWGTYQTLQNGPGYNVKLIAVQPGQSPSYQVHAKRSEHWVIVSGSGQVTIDDAAQLVHVNDHVFINAGQKHTILCTSSEPLVFIEVQTGTYFGEDDIIRISDRYGRI